MAICCPKTFTGFCLDDQTPVAITIDNGVLISWTNLVTGVVTPGNPPAGTGVCEVPSTIIVEVEIPPVTFDPLTCVKDSVTICPGDDPIPVTVLNFPASVEVEVSNDVGNPLPVSGTDFDIRNLVCGQDAVDACVTFDYAEDSLHVSGDSGAFVLAVRNDAGTPLAGDGDYIPFTTDATGALRVNATFSGDITVALDCATDSVTICPGVDPIVVSGTVELGVTTLAALETITVNQGTSPWVVSGTVSVNEPITVDAVDFDIRNLDCATDSITVCPPVSGAFDVDVINEVIIRPLDCVTDSVTICPPVSGIFDVNTTFDYPEDSPHVSGDIGAFILGVRNDNGSTILTSDNGDYSPFAVDDRGRLQVLVTSSVGSPAADNNSIWTISAAPASGVLATATRATPGVGKQLVVTSVTVAIAAGLGILAGAAVLTTITASGGTVLWRGVLGVTAVVGSSTSIAISFAIPVPTNESVTVAFSTGVTSAVESVALSGYVSTL